MQHDDFNRVLLAAIDEGLSLLGSSLRETVFCSLENFFQLKKKDNPMNLMEFSQALERIFGPGAVHLEKIVIDCLAQKIEIDLEDRDFIDLLACVGNTKRRIMMDGEVEKHG